MTGEYYVNCGEFGPEHVFQWYVADAEGTVIKRGIPEDVAHEMCDELNAALRSSQV